MVRSVQWSLSAASRGAGKKSLDIRDTSGILVCAVRAFMHSNRERKEEFAFYKSKLLAVFDKLGEFSAHIVLFWLA